MFYFAAIVVAGIWLSVLSVLGVDCYDTGMNWGFSFSCSPQLGSTTIGRLRIFDNPSKGLS